MIYICNITFRMIYHVLGAWIFMLLCMSSNIMNEVHVFVLFVCLFVFVFFCFL
jgi:hypothetical protein